MLEFTINSPEEMERFGAELAQVIEAGVVISLVGELGAGKTTLVKGVAQALGITEPIKSPTYPIVREYDLPNSENVLYHIDAYRLEEGGADTVDIPKFISNHAYTFIEWAEFIKEYMPSSFIRIEIQTNESKGRDITVSVDGDNAKYSRKLTNLAETWKG